MDFAPLNAAANPGYDVLAPPEDLGHIDNSKVQRCGQFAVSNP